MRQTDVEILLQEDEQEQQNERASLSISLLWHVLRIVVQQVDAVEYVFDAAYNVSRQQLVAQH